MTVRHVSTTDEQVEYLRYHRTKVFYEDDTTVFDSTIMISEETVIATMHHYGHCLEVYPAQHQEVLGGYQFLMRSSPNVQIRGIIIVFKESMSETYTPCPHDDTVCRVSFFVCEKVGLI